MIQRPKLVLLVNWNFNIEAALRSLLLQVIELLFITWQVWSRDSLKEYLVVADESAAETDDGKERHCDSLIMCIVTTLNEGLRNGGGIGDVLRKPSSMVTQDSYFVRLYTI